MLLVFPRDLLALFGSEYTVGAVVTIILALGQLWNAGTGPCGALLNMSGHIRLNMVNNALTLALNIALNIALIPPFGIVGAAVAWSSSLATVNLARVVEVWYLYRIVPMNRSTGKVPIAAGAACAVAMAIRVILHGSVSELIVGVGSGAVVYCLALWLLGLDADDLAGFRSLIGRPRRQ
jgi:O-antigen/teichoic acid export membrane protein